MRFLTQFGLEKSRLTILVMIGLLFMGAMTYVSLPKRENPAVTIRTVKVYAAYPGMSPERIEDLVATPLERAGREIAEVDEIKSLIQTGSVTIDVNIDESVPSSELDRVFQDVRNKMNDNASELPEGTIGPVVNTDFGDVAVATFAITGEGFSYEEMYDAADDLRAQLYDIDGITKVAISGRQEERIWLEVDTRRLAAVGIQLNQVVADLAAQNVILPAGEIEGDGTTIILEANGDLKTVEEISDVLTKVSDQAGFVRLRDLMTVRRGYVDPPEKPIYFNGKPALMVSVEMSEDRDIQQIGRVLREALPTFEARQPIGISYHISTFQETAVNLAVNNALTNVGQTFAVVLLVMMAFLGLRAAFVIASIVPFTVMFALMGMAQIGIDLEQISIAAVIISLGLLVDNGLVVVEDISERINAGTDPREAALQSGGQFFIPLAVASITTVSAFVPMLILDGAEGDFAFSLGAVVGLMLLGSWLTAHYILPFIAAAMLRPRKESSKAVEKEEGLVIRLYGSLVRFVLPLGLPVVVGCYILVALTASQFGVLKKEMFPLSERNEFLIYMDMPKGTSIEATRDEALALNDWLLDENANPEVDNTTIFVGDGGPRFYLALNPADANPASAFLLVNTSSPEGAIAMSERARNYMFENLPGARSRVTRLSMGGAESGIVDIEISGPDADAMLRAAKELEIALASVPHIIMNQNDWGNKTLKIVVDVAQDKARELGVSSEDISEVMEAFFSGHSFSNFRDGEDYIPMEIRSEKGFRDSIEDLSNLSIPANGQLISLSQVADFRPQLEYSQLRRFDQERQLTVSGKSDTLSAFEVLDYIMPTLERLQTELGDDHSIEVAGEIADSSEVNEKLAAGMPLALGIMLAALVFQFNSARRVLLTFMTIPLILIGSPVALRLTEMPMSFFAILGMISLMGIIINNAIVLIDQIDLERETLPLDDAVIAAAKKRVTPVLLTSLTTVLGLLPMAITGGALFEPMATLMIGGLVASSPLSLIFVPPLYRLLFRWEDRWRARQAKGGTEVDPVIA